MKAERAKEGQARPGAASGPGHDPSWQETYADLVTTADKAVARIRPGQRVFLGTGCAQPQELVRALVARGPYLPDVQIVNLLMVGEVPYSYEDLVRHFTVNAFFVSSRMRRMIQEGLGDYTPILVSDIPRLFSSGELPLDVALIHVSPPDERGLCSLGVSVDIVKSAAANAGLVIAQVNPQMPRTLGDSFVDVFDIDLLVPVDEPVLEARPEPPDEVSTRIAEHVASLIEDGSTIELGIGSVPHVLLDHLHDKKDLGVHTETLRDAYVDLVEEGVITGSRKTRDRGKMVASFCLGTRRLYDFLNENPGVAMHPTEYVNDPRVIGEQHKMVAVNAALEVDLTGQVCADSIGTRFFSGIGGQADFNRGAARSDGGKAVIVLPSTAEGGRISRIVVTLTPGAGVVTTRGDVHYVVTEYGVAYLHGKSVQDRALALISIAHPDFRAQLLGEAIEVRYLRPELADVAGRISIGPRELSTSLLLDDGTQVAVRTINPTDTPSLKDFFYDLSRESIYFRFMQHLTSMPQRQIQDFVYTDHRNEVSLVATLPEAGREEILAVAGYYLDQPRNRAEVAFLVADEWQDRGLGSFLLRHLITIAKRNGIAGFYGEALRENRAMQAVLRKSGCKMRSHVEEGVFFFELDFS
jgi:acyl-CoA hydrolase/RimJ/RimL family protein N-acetyltransferase